MDNNVVVERRINSQLTEQNIQMAQVEQNLIQSEQHRDKLAKNIEVLEAQINNMDGNVQFLNTSVDSKQKLYQYIGQNAYSLQDDIAWFTINSNGKDHFILTYGSFKELSQARAVFSQLPHSRLQTVLVSHV